MTAYEDYGQKIWNHYQHEYCKQEILSWGDFIRVQDIGILYDTFDYGRHFYVIVDKHKWFLSKIKYGI